jgi:hypothetical protein
MSLVVIRVWRDFSPELEDFVYFLFGAKLDWTPRGERHALAVRQLFPGR